MKRADSIAMHRATCRDDMCNYCQNRAEERAYDEPIDTAEESARADQYERWLGI